MEWLLPLPNCKRSPLTLKFWNFLEILSKIQDQETPRRESSLLKFEISWQADRVHPILLSNEFHAHFDWKNSKNWHLIWQYMSHYVFMEIFMIFEMKSPSNPSA